jgi:glycerol dehydrogenase-like iron-containing ADH family enzyme
MEIKWTPPHMDWCKANWDVALQKNAKLVGIGVIVQDHNGRMVAARSFTKRGVLEQKIRETIASFHAAQLCKELGLQDVILEGDARSVAEAINGNCSN